MLAVLTPAPPPEVRTSVPVPVGAGAAAVVPTPAAVRLAAGSGVMLLASPGLATLATATAPAAWQQVLHSSEMLHKFEEIRQQLVQTQAQRHALIATGVGVTGGLSIGYVVWLIRGGVLVSSMLSALPAWQMVDPLPILAAGRVRDEPASRKKRRGSPAPAPARDEADVEKLFDAKRGDR